MGGVQNSLDGEILQIGKQLLEILKNALCPDFVRDGDSIILTAPWEEEDYRVGVYLYDIQDYSIVMPQSVTISESERRFPDKAVELSYLIFCNQNHRFGGQNRESYHTVLNEIVRAVHDNPIIEENSESKVQLSFLREDAEFKIRLWGSFDQPLRPAVYVKVAPVIVKSSRTKQVHLVKKRDYDVNKV